MTDRELLEMAAKAAGIRPIAWGVQFDSYGWFCEPTGEHWNALTDDGDALRLAVKLGLVVDCSRPSAGEPFKLHHFAQEDFKDPYAATRRAIVLAAAEIGKAVQKPLAP